MMNGYGLSTPQVAMNLSGLDGVHVSWLEKPTRLVCSNGNCGACERSEYLSDLFEGRTVTRVTSEEEGRSVTTDNCIAAPKTLVDVTHTSSAPMLGGCEVDIEFNPARLFYF